MAFGQALLSWALRIALMAFLGATLAYMAGQPLDEAARRVHELLTIIPR